MARQVRIVSKEFRGLFILAERMTRQSFDANSDVSSNRNNATQDAARTQKVSRRVLIRVVPMRGAGCDIRASRPFHRSGFQPVSTILEPKNSFAQGGCA